MKKIIRFASMLSCAVLVLACAGRPAQQSAEEIETDTIKTMVVEGTRVTWLRDNAEAKLNPVSLFPSASAELVESLGLKDGIPASMSAFLIQEDGHNLLFDAGMGSPASLLLSSLDTLGVKPEDVDYVFITHMHGDHIGGMVKDGQPVFPNAKVYLSREEQEGWMNMAPERNASQLKFMDIYKDQLVIFNYGDILPFSIRALDSRGHTPGHTTFLKGKLMIVGDIMHGVALQLADPSINATYDSNPEQAAESRIRMIEYARDNECVMAGMHFADPGFLDYR